MSTPWQRLPADLPVAARPRLPDTVRTIADAVGEAVRDAATVDNAKFERDVRTAVQVALERFLDLAGTDEPALPPAIREVFVALGAAEARENRGPEVLLATLRMAARLMLRMTSESCRNGSQSTTPMSSAIANVSEKGWISGSL